MAERERERERDEQEKRQTCRRVESLYIAIAVHWSMHATCVVLTVKNLVNVRLSECKCFLFQYFNLAILHDIKNLRKL